MGWSLPFRRRDLAVASVVVFCFGLVAIQITNGNEPESTQDERFLEPNIIRQRQSTGADDIDSYYYTDDWITGSSKIQPNSFQVQPYVSNGYIGIRLPVEGSGFTYATNSSDGENIALNGWPLDNPRYTGAFIAGFYDSQEELPRTNFEDLVGSAPESPIASIPVWSTLWITTAQGNSYSVNVDPSEVINYDQKLNMRYGYVNTTVKWKPPSNSSDSGGIQLAYTIFTSRKRMGLGVVRLELTADNDTQIYLSDINDGAGAERTEAVNQDVVSDSSSMYTVFRPQGLNSSYDAILFSTLDFSDSSRVDYGQRRASSLASSNATTISQQFPITLSAGQPFTIVKYVGIATNPLIQDSLLRHSSDITSSAKDIGFTGLFSEHHDAWESLWGDVDIVVPGNKDIQTYTRATLYHLLTNIGDFSNTADSITVGGLSSDSYAGFIFWDADLWMNLGINALFPEFSKPILDYRYNRLDQAKENAKSVGLEGAAYPWTSARIGQCTSSGPCVNYQYHLNTDIAMAFWYNYLATRDVEYLREKAWPVIEGAANMFASYVVKNESTQGYYMTFNMTDPDEYANFINNGAYTNAGISQLMEWAQRAAEILSYDAPSVWSDIEHNMYIPQANDSNLILEYDGMNNSVTIKQADVIMLAYPLEYDWSYDQAHSSIVFYSEAQSEDGPAMTQAMYSIAEAQIQLHGCASYTYLLEGVEPFIRKPFYQFSEQKIDNFYLNGGTNPAFPFLTGHGGFLQTWTHGYTGFRLREDVVYLNPSLPPQLTEGYILKGLKWQGNSLDVAIGLDETTINLRSRQDGATTVVVRISSDHPAGGDYPLDINGTVTIPTRRVDLNRKVLPDDLDDLAMCRPVSSNSETVWGHYPFAPFDGSNSTRWQPASDLYSSLTVDLGNTTSINSYWVTWGSVPAKYVYFGIADGPTDAANVQWIVERTEVGISSPYDPDRDIYDFEDRPFNTTHQRFDNDVDARYVRFGFEGSYSNDGKGGIVVGTNVFYNNTPSG